MEEIPVLKVVQVSCDDKKYLSAMYNCLPSLATIEYKIGEWVKPFVGNIFAFDARLPSARHNAFEFVDDITDYSTRKYYHVLSGIGRLSVQSMNRVYCLQMYFIKGHGIVGLRRFWETDELTYKEIFIGPTQVIPMGTVFLDEIMLEKVIG